MEAKKVVGGNPGGDLVGRRPAQIGQGDVRAPGLALRRKTGPAGGGLAALLEQGKLWIGGDADPQRGGRSGRFKRARAGQRHRRRGAGDGLQRLVEIVGRRLLDLAGEAQGDVQRLGRPPPRAREAAAETCKPRGKVRRDGDGDEQPDQRRALRTRATAGARRPAISRTPAALG